MPQPAPPNVFATCGPFVVQHEKSWLVQAELERYVMTPWLPHQTVYRYRRRP
jgi:hypothetical protein